MSKNNGSGLGLVGVLLIIGALVITTGGVLVWQKKIFPIPTPTPLPVFVPEVTISPKPTSRSEGGCIIGGCNGELCLDESSERRDTVCRWLPQYECFRTATCERQADGYCGWTQTKELMDCLNKFNGKDCAVDGESPTNFDMTTGKLIPGGKPCCQGLKAISPRTPQESLDKGLCIHKTGSVGVCRPCGDGICNTDYEDRCNCPEDCR